eukprot:scaffold108591_cov45-Attheya_sp.AAC.5
MANNRTSASSSCPLEMDVLQKRNSDLEAAFRNQRNRRNLKANEELIQKQATDEPAGRFSLSHLAKRIDSLEEEVANSQLETRTKDAATRYEVGYSLVDSKQWGK